MRTFLRTLLLVMFAAGAMPGCSEPTPPPVPPPRLEPPADSTSHTYTWEYTVLGGFGSTMSAVAADGDDNVWAAGDIDLGHEIPSTPSGRFSSRANAVHITPEGNEMYCFQLDEGYGVSPSALYGVTIRNGLPTVWMSIAATTYYGGDSVQYQTFNDWGSALSYYKPGKSGEVYMYGWKGFLGRFDAPDYKRRQQLPTGTAKPIRAFTQVGPNEFYVGGWSHDSSGGIFHHLRDGQVMAVSQRITEDTQLGYAMALWSSPERLHAYCPPYFYIQSLKEPHAWDAIHGRTALGGTVYGAIICATGRADNDVFFAGHFATLIHYNGRGLHYYSELPQLLPNSCIFYDIAVTPHHVFIVGEHNGFPVLVKGTKVAR